MNSVKPREKRQKRENHYTDIGVRGRKTGVLIRKNILQDEDGLDNIDDFFESSSEEEVEVPKFSTQRQNIDTNHADLETTFEESADMELSTESGITYSEQSSVSSIVKQRTKVSPYGEQGNRSAYSAKRTHHVFEESRDSPDIGLVKKKIDFRSKLSPKHSSVVASTPKLSRLGQHLPRGLPTTFDTPSQLSQSMEDSVLSGSDASPSILEPSHDQADDSNLSTSFNQQTNGSFPELNEEVDEAISDANLSEDDTEMSPIRRPSPPKPKNIRQATRTEAIQKPISRKKPTKAKPQSQTHLAEDEEEPGVRRSRRTKVKPLDFWRNERIVYGRRKSGPNVVSVVKEIVTVPVDHQPLSKKPKRKVGGKKTRNAEESEEEYNDKPIDEITILDWFTGEEVKQVVGLTKDMVVTKPVKNQTFEFEKTFGESTFMSSGIIKLCRNGMKPKRNSGDNAMVFFVISGSCRVTIHSSSFNISAGGQFHVPRGNQYQLENIGSNETRLFFAQARETVPAE